MPRLNDQKNAAMEAIDDFIKIRSNDFKKLQGTIQDKCDSVEPGFVPDYLLESGGKVSIIIELQDQFRVAILEHLGELAQTSGTAANPARLIAKSLFANPTHGDDWKASLTTLNGKNFTTLYEIQRETSVSVNAASVGVFTHRSNAATSLSTKKEMQQQVQQSDDTEIVRRPPAPGRSREVE